MPGLRPQYLVKFFTGVALGIGLFALVSCSDSPLSSRQVKTAQTTVKGSVALSDFQNARGAFVWFSGFDLSTWVDSLGNFSLVIPNKNEQGAPFPLSGVFTIYFYVANYGLDSAEVVIQNGEFAYGRGDLLLDGTLKTNKVLNKFLRVRTQITPAAITDEYAGDLRVELFLDATNANDSVTVVLPGLADEKRATMLLQNKDDGSIRVLQTDRFSAPELKNTFLVEDTTIAVSMTFPWAQHFVRAGEYALIPYLFIHHEKIPAGLMRALGSDIESPGEGYMKIPFRREGNGLLVRPGTP